MVGDWMGRPCGFVIASSTTFPLLSADRETSSLTAGDRIEDVLLDESTPRRRIRRSPAAQPERAGSPADAAGQRLQHHVIKVTSEAAWANQGGPAMGWPAC